MRTLGIDLGGTNIKVAVVELADPPRVLLEEQDETHAELGPDAVLERMAALGLRAIQTAGPVDAAGVGAPGPLDMEAGKAIFMANLPGWENRPIAAPLAERLGVRVALINDVRAYTLAEHRLGAGRGCANLVCFALGTGVGGGIVVGGKLLLNLGGTAGEVGHMAIEPDGPPCPCGSRGCLEQYASGPAIARFAGAAHADDVVAAARAGDAGALAALERAGTNLGIGIANVVLAVGPERVVVGGGVAEAGELLLAPARAELVRRVRVMPVERVSVVRAALGPFAGAVGAALWAGESDRS